MSLEKKLDLIYTTVQSMEQATTLANDIVKNKLAACVNIIPNGISVYAWQNKVEQQTECYLLCKSTPTMSLALVEWLQTNHPYDTAAIIKFNTETADDFFNYINSK